MEQSQSSIIRAWAKAKKEKTGEDTTSPSNKIGNRYLYKVGNGAGFRNVSNYYGESKAPELNYETNISLNIGEAFDILPNSVGKVLSWSIYPELPEGVYFDTTDGRIEGKFIKHGVNTYTVTAENLYGKTTQNITFTRTQTFRTDTDILTDALTGYPCRYTISPALPSGVSLNSLGQISYPAFDSRDTQNIPLWFEPITYTISRWDGNPVKEADAPASRTFARTAKTQKLLPLETYKVQLHVKPIFPTIFYRELVGKIGQKISFSNEYLTNTAKPINEETGSALHIDYDYDVTFSIEPKLPRGLTFNKSTGGIGGSPKVLDIKGTKYKITATNNISKEYQIVDLIMAIYEGRSEAVNFTTNVSSNRNYGFNLIFTQPDTKREEAKVSASIIGSTYTIDWGDGNIETRKVSQKGDYCSHTYANDYYGIEVKVICDGLLGFDINGMNWWSTLLQFQYLSPALKFLSCRWFMSGVIIEPITKLKGLTTLNMSGNNINSDIDLSSLTELKELYMSSNSIVNITLPPNVTDVELNSNQIRSIDLSNTPNLNYIDLSGNDLRQFDISRCELNSLTELYLNDNPRLDENFLDISSAPLDYIELSNCGLTNIPGFINQSINSLNLSSNQISEIPEWFESKTVDYLDLSSNIFETVCHRIPALNQLNLSNNLITDVDTRCFPDMLGSLLMENNLLSYLDVTGFGDNLQNLQLRNNKFSKFPDLRVTDHKAQRAGQIWRAPTFYERNPSELPRLISLNLSNNLSLNHVEPTFLNKLTKLNILGLSYCNLSSFDTDLLPSSLRYLYLDSNQLTGHFRLPLTSRISELNLSSNQIETIDESEGFTNMNNFMFGFNRPIMVMFNYTDLAIKLTQVWKDENAKIGYGTYRQLNVYGNNLSNHPDQNTWSTIVNNASANSINITYWG